MSENTTQSPWVSNTSDATFEQDAIERSREAPVVVDFWTTGCQPCRMLTPVLERLADEFDGQFLLVKADGAHCQRAAAEFGVQGFPTVFALRNGEPVDYFEGMLPEPQVRQWLERFLPSDADNLIAEAQQLRESDLEAAIEKIKQAIELQPNEIGPKLKLAELLIGADRFDEAESLLQELSEAGYDNNDVTQLLSAVQVKLSGQQSGGSAAARAACQTNPSDQGLQLTLAETLTAESEYEEALQLALAAVQADKTTHGERARTIMVGIFNLLPGDSELTREYRRKLSAALY